MKIGLVIAMDSEYRQFEQLLGGSHGRVGAGEVVLARCGIGKVNAAVNTYNAIGLDDEYTRCIQQFASMGAAGQKQQGLKIRWR